MFQKPSLNTWIQSTRSFLLMCKPKKACYLEEKSVLAKDKMAMAKHYWIL